MNDELYMLRMSINEKDATIARLRNDLERLRAAIEAHRDVNGQTVPAGGHRRSDKALWELVDTSA
jgi:hypothetical protein